MQYVIGENAIGYADERGTILAEVTFPDAPDLGADVVRIDHTFVDESLRGRGVAGELLSRAADVLEKSGRRAVPTCTYAVRWFEKHPERAGLLAEPAEG